MNNLSMVFCTCDAYMDLSDNFFVLLHKYWPEFKGDIFFNTDTKKYTSELYNIINVVHHEKNSSWSQRLYDSLKLVTTDFVLLFLDDFYLEGKVNNKEFLSCLQYIEGHKEVNGIAFTLEPGIKKPLKNELSEFSIRKHFAQYKCTAHISIYRTSFLKKILKRNENAWEFEVNGTIRSFLKKGKFICKNNRNFTFPYSYGLLVRQGSYDKKLKEHFESFEGLEFSVTRPLIDTSKKIQRKKANYNMSCSGCFRFLQRILYENGFK